MEKTVNLAVRALAEFVMRSGSIDSRFSGTDRAAQGSRIHRKLQKAGGENYKAEVFLKGDRIINDFHYFLEGRADGVFTENDEYFIDEIKTVAVPIDMIKEDFCPEHWAQAQCYAAFFCNDNSLQFINIRLSYYQIDTDEIVRFSRRYYAPELEEKLVSYLKMYEPFARFSFEWKIKSSNSAKTVKFPYNNYRNGQYEMARAVYKTVDENGILAAIAPTGIGKTMSTLFPAIKSIGEKKASKIFYLTAKTIGCIAAQDATKLLKQKNTLSLKNLTLTAKDKVCLLEERDCTPEACKYANGYYNRINMALIEILQNVDDFTQDNIKILAEKYTLCPFELALDLSLFCDLIICDYNYLFDPVVSLKRFFSSSKNDYIFLIDEAHNLPDRACSMYSAMIDKQSFQDLKKLLGKKHKGFCNVITKVITRFNEFEIKDDVLINKDLDDALFKTIINFNSYCSDWIDKNKQIDIQKQVLDVYFKAKFFVRIAELYDSHYTSVFIKQRKNVFCKLLCLDASEFIMSCLSLGKASVLFSATLYPLDYYKTTIGIKDCKRIILDSPFNLDNLCILSATHCSTKYIDRQKSLDEICNLINCTVNSKRGNYIIFMPSYTYLKELSDAYIAKFKDTNVYIQQSDMTTECKDEFLSRFTENENDNITAFCVLGGVFSEGIDLAGSRLIGSIVVGVGLPMISAEQNTLRDYYDNLIGDGFAYAYQYPGFCKVLQAAGRVIRTETDKGVVLLIDSRYSQGRYKMLFPTHWANVKEIHSTIDAEILLKDFWET